MAAPKQTDPQFKLRLTPEVKANIERAANKSGRSMNAEILWRLERSFMTEEQIAEEEIVEMNRETRQRLARIEEKLEQFEFDQIFERIAREATIKRPTRKAGE